MAARNAVRQPLDPQESHRLADAARSAFTAQSGVTITYTIELLNIDAEPTIVSARPTGPPTSRPGGGTCRAIELSVVKNGSTTTGMLTVCRDAGSGEMKASDL